MLHEAEELGIKLLVLYQLNILSRSTVDVDLSFLVPNELKEEFMYEITGDPIDLIPNNVFEFYDRYTFTEKYPSTQLPYNEINLRFWTATKLYERLINQLQSHAREVIKENKQNNKSKSKLRNMIKNKK